jgi:hypothetical protein
VTYSFLEPLLWEAYRTGHLGADRVPPLIDTDRTSVVKARSFPYLDPFKLGRGKVSVIWGLLMTFRLSWLAQVGLLMLDVRAAMLPRKASVSSSDRAVALHDRGPGRSQPPADLRRDERIARRRSCE